MIDEHHELLVGPRHALANARAVTPAQLAGHRIWMPGMAAGTEWASYYDELAAAFGLTIDMVGPVFGNEALLAEIADSAELATLAGERTRYLWPDSYDLRRIPVRDPAPIYPMSLIWRDDNPHPALSRLRDHLGSRRVDTSDEKVWLPTWHHLDGPPAAAGPSCSTVARNLVPSTMVHQSSGAVSGWVPGSASTVGAAASACWNSCDTAVAPVTRVHGRKPPTRSGCSAPTARKSTLVRP